MTTTHRNICPKCQSPIPPDAPGGLCPKCVMAGVGTTAKQTREGIGDAPSMEHLAPIFPQFEIIELIGRGGMGFVFKARQRHLDREVALKLLPEKLGTDPHFAERFMREARVLAKLNHPNIVMVHDFGHVGGFYYLVMEYVEGLNLRQAMRMGKFSPAEALAIVPKICDALQFAHEQGVLHRDIKPENLLLDARGRVKIADFGIAKMVGEEKGAITLTGTGAALGTPHYMAPEQFENPGDVDHRADIYSLGVVFYEMLTGELPIGRFSAPSVRTEMDERIDAIVLRALAREREQRQKDARELQTEVEGLAAPSSRLESKPQVNGRSRVRGFCFRHRGKLAWSGAALVLLLLLFVILTQKAEHNRLLAEYYAAVSQQSPPSQDLVLPQPVSPEPVLYFAATNVALPVDEEKLRVEEEKIQTARQRYETAKEQHSRGEITSRDLALANRDLAIAEARGEAIAVATAGYQFAEWEFRQILDSGKDDAGYTARVFQGELDYVKAQHALSLARAGTNQLQIASADLKAAEMNLGAATRVRHKGALSDEELKKFENEYFYADMKHKRLKQNQPSEK